MRELALFAGAGGGILGGKILGWQTVCAVERDAYQAAVLAQRQNDGCFSTFPIWSEMETFDGKPWNGIVDVVSGGFPCQDISYAGRGAGIEHGKRSGLWREMRRVVCEVQPRFVFVENTSALIDRGIGRVLADLAELGYDAEWGVFCSCQTRKLHHRKRVFILAYSAKDRRGFLQDDCKKRKSKTTAKTCDNRADSEHWQALPIAEFWGGTDGLADWIQPSWKSIGNGQDPEVVALAWKTLSGINL